MWGEEVSLITRWYLFEMHKTKISMKGLSQEAGHHKNWPFLSQQRLDESLFSDTYKGYKLKQFGTSRAMIKGKWLDPAYHPVIAIIWGAELKKNN